MRSSWAMKAYVCGVSTRKVDELVAALGCEGGISKSEVSRICQGLDTQVQAFLNRPLCAHLGVIATRNNRGVAHESGAIEGQHPHWKHRLEQPLIQRGRRAFETEVEYRQLVAQVSAGFNDRTSVRENLSIERLHLRPLPVERFADYETLVVRVRQVTYSVPSRQIGHQLTVHLPHDRLELLLRSRFTLTLPRLHRRKGESEALRRIDFRHGIESLRCKARAAARPTAVRHPPR